MLSLDNRRHCNRVEHMLFRKLSKVIAVWFLDLVEILGPFIRRRKDSVDYLVVIQLAKRIS